MRYSKATINELFIKRLKSEYCFACLSSDRKLSSLGEYSEIYHNLFKQYANAMVTISEVNLCYECRALLRNIKKFQEKVLHSYEILDKHFKDKEYDIKSKSSLVINKTVFISTLDDYDDNISEPYKAEVKEEVKEYNNYFDGFDNEPLEEIQEEPYQVLQENEDKLNTSELKFDIASHTPNCNEQHNTLQQTNTATDIIKEKSSSKQDKNKSKKGNGRQSSLPTPIRRSRDCLYPKTGKPIKVNRRFFERALNILYRVTGTNFPEKLANIYTTIPIPPQQVKYWLERERNSFYFKDLKNKCEKCVLRVSVPRMKAHKQLHVEKKFTCDICGQSFVTKYHIIQHLRQHFHIRSCTTCGYKCISPAHIYRHARKEHYKKVQCLECNDCFKTIREYSKHFKEIHYKFHSTFICDYCNETFHNKHVLEKHMHTHFEVDSTFICDYCNKIFPTKRVIKKHITKCDRRLICEPCDKTFSTLKSLRRHISLKHRIERSEASYCVTCDRQFDTVEQFKVHVKTAVAHAAERKISEKKRFPCPDCEKTYCAKFVMKHHYELVHLNKIRFFCNDCNKAYTKNTALRRHLKYSKAHGGQLPKNKLCKFCGQGFSSNTILTHHIRTHTGERPHACPHCDSKFAQKVAMVMHIRNIHKKKEHEKNMDE